MTTPTIATALERLPTALRTEAGFAGLFDHTLLKVDATAKQIDALCQDALSAGFKAVCVNPTYVAQVAKTLASGGGTRPLVCSVVGFPLGACRTDIKIDETLRAVGDGAQEIDMVINVGRYLSGEASLVRHDIAAVVKCAGQARVKVILETAYLTPAQIGELTRWTLEAGAAFVKTSTGFGARGASVADIETMASVCAGKMGIKASGGIRTLADTLALVAAGATRIGASASVQILADFKTALAGPGST